MREVRATDRSECTSIPVSSLLSQLVASSVSQVKQSTKALTHNIDMTIDLLGPNVCISTIFSFLELNVLRYSSRRLFQWL